MSRPWMPLYIADYLADTGHLSTVEHGAYILLIMHYWKTGGLPNGEEQLARIVRLPLEQWSSIATTIKAFFDDDLCHDRIDAELAKAAVKYENRANAGRKGGQAKAKAKQNSSNAKARLYQPQPQPDTKTDDSAREVSKLEEGELFATAGGSLGSSPNLFVMAEPMRWKAAGMDWLGDIIPAIRTAAVKCRPGSVQSWNYFSQAIADWHEARTKPMPKGANGNARSPRTTTADLARQLSRAAEQREAERDDGSSFQAAGLISRAG